MSCALWFGVCLSLRLDSEAFLCSSVPRSPMGGQDSQNGLEMGIPFSHAEGYRGWDWTDPSPTSGSSDKTQQVRLWLHTDRPQIKMVQLAIFQFYDVQKLHAFSRNHTPSSECWSLLRLLIRHGIFSCNTGQRQQPQVSVNYAIMRTKKACSLQGIVLLTYDDQ